MPATPASIRSPWSKMARRALDNPPPSPPISPWSGLPRLVGWCAGSTACPSRFMLELGTESSGISLPARLAAKNVSSTPYPSRLAGRCSQLQPFAAVVGGIHPSPPLCAVAPLSLSLSSAAPCLCFPYCRRRHCPPAPFVVPNCASIGAAAYCPHRRPGEHFRGPSSSLLFLLPSFFPIFTFKLPPTASCWPSLIYT